MSLVRTREEILAQIGYDSETDLEHPTDLFSVRKVLDIMYHGMK